MSKEDFINAMSDGLKKTYDQTYGTRDGYEMVFDLIPRFRRERAPILSFSELHKVAEYFDKQVKCLEDSLRKHRVEEVTLKDRLKRSSWVIAMLATATFLEAVVIANLLTANL